MILAISGKKNSGKDLVYNIINYLTYKYKYENKGFRESFNSYLQAFQEGKIRQKQNYFENIKFADKLKDIVCLLIGCTREQLEDREFKEKELGEEWRIYKAIYIDQHDNGIKLFTNRDEAEEWLDGGFFLSTIIEEKILTPRILMQEIGTDLFRNQLHPDIWINSVFSNYKKENYTNIGQPDFDWNNQQNEPKPFYPKWCITDLRFKNELKVIKDRQGITIRVNRKQYTEYKEKIIECYDIHPSESELDNEIFDIVIDNNGTIEELIEQIDTKLFKNDVFRNLLL